MTDIVEGAFESEGSAIKCVIANGLQVKEGVIFPSPNVCYTYQARTAISYLSERFGYIFTTAPETLLPELEEAP